jgi:trimeric autotransporter adhesin
MVAVLAALLFPTVLGVPVELPSPRPVLTETVAGSGEGFPGAASGFAGDGGPATTARLARPAQVSADGKGGFYIADSSNQRIRYVDPAGRMSTAVGNGRQGDCGDNGMAWDLCLNLPHGVLALGGGIYIADTFNHKVRFVDGGGRMRTIVGPDDHLSLPVSVQPGPDGGVLITDAGANRVLLYREGRLSTVAGNGTKGFAGDGGPAADAQLSAPADAVAYRGGVAIADGTNCRVRLVVDGRIDTIAGSGDPGFCQAAADAFAVPSPAPSDEARGLGAGTSVDARAAWIGVPGHMAVMNGSLYVADVLDNSVRDLKDGQLTTVVGGGSAPAFSGDTGSPRATSLAWPSGLSVLRPGQLLISDPGNNRVRVLRDPT